MWHQMDWRITIADSNVLRRGEYHMERPMWFHCDQKLYYEAASRKPSTQNVWYILGRLDELFRTFQKSLLRCSRFEVFRTFFEKATHDQRRKLPSTNVTTTKSEIHQSWLESWGAKVSMKPFRYYSVYTLQLASSFGFNATRVADRIMWEYIARIGSIILYLFSRSPLSEIVW